MTENALAGLNVLILEDEPLVSMMTEDMIMEMGGRVVGPFSRLDALRKHVESTGPGCDVALLDVNVNGERSTGVAEMLRELNVPIVFCTGYDDAGLSEEWRSVPRLSKPFTDTDLLAVTREALNR